MKKGKVTIRIHRKVSKRKYLDGKRTYTYERFYVPTPKQFHDKIEPFLNKNLKVEVQPKNGGLKISCTPRENVSAPRNVLPRVLGYKKLFKNVNNLFAPTLLYHVAVRLECAEAQA